MDVFIQQRRYSRGVNKTRAWLMGRCSFVYHGVGAASIGFDGLADARSPQQMRSSAPPLGVYTAMLSQELMFTHVVV